MKKRPACVPSWALVAALSAGPLTILAAAPGCNDETSAAPLEEGPGACENPSDMAAREAAYCPGNRSVTKIASRCGIQCLLQEDAGGCTTDCIVLETAGALSSPCASCVSDTVVCARDHCLNECISDPESDLCLGCRCGANKDSYNCLADYEKCSGIHLEDCDKLAEGTWTGYPELDGGCGGGGGGG